MIKNMYHNKWEEGKLTNEEKRRAAAFYLAKAPTGLPPDTTDYRKQFVGMVVCDLYNLDTRWEAFVDEKDKHPEARYQELYRYICNKLYFLKKKPESTEKTKALRSSVCEPMETRGGKLASPKAKKGSTNKINSQFTFKGDTESDSSSAIVSSKKSTPKKRPGRPQQPRIQQQPDFVPQYISRVFKGREEAQRRWIICRERVKKYKRRLTTSEVHLAEAVHDLFQGAGHVDSDVDQSVLDPEENFI